MGTVAQIMQSAALQPRTVTRGLWPQGLMKQGNIDLDARPMVRNKDGSISTVRSASFGLPGGLSVLLPTVIGNKIVSNKDAYAHYEKTGEHLGIFDTDESADAYSKALHEEQAQDYNPEPNDHDHMLDMIGQFLRRQQTRRNYGNEAKAGARK